MSMCLCVYVLVFVWVGVYLRVDVGQIHVLVFSYLGLLRRLYW